MAAVISLVHGGGGAVADAVMLARAIRRIIREDLGWPFGYNLLLVRLTAAGILLPVLAAVAIATRSVTVVGNAPWLRRFHPCATAHSRRRVRAGQYRSKQMRLAIIELTARHLLRQMRSEHRRRPDR